MHRVITYQADLPNVGNYAGKLVVVKPPTSPIRFQVGSLTKENHPPRVREWENSTGRGVKVDLWVDEAVAKFGHDHWPLAEAVLREHFPDHELLFID